MINDSDIFPDPPLPVPAGAGVPKGVCIVCGSGLLMQYYRGHPDNQRIQCNDCGTEVTVWMHSHKQPNDKLSGGGPLSNKTTEAEPRRPLE